MNEVDLFLQEGDSILLGGRHNLASLLHLTVGASVLYAIEQCRLSNWIDCSRRDHG
jgi:hypothetical protein